MIYIFKKKIFLAIILFFSFLNLFPESISLSSKIEKRNIYIGEKVLYQIKVNGTDKSSVKSVPKLNGFEISFIGSSPNNSSQITIINGKTTKLENKSVVHSFYLTPSAEGTFQIPSFEIEADTTVYNSDPFSVNVTKASESEFFKLSLEVDKNSVFIGEPNILKVKWYIAKDVSSYTFNIPIFNNPDFMFQTLPAEGTAPKTELEVGNTVVEAGRITEALNGSNYTVFTMRFKFLSNKAGVYEIPSSSITVKTKEGGRGRNSSGSFFFGSNDSYKKYFVSSEPLKLNVKKLPVKGRPSDFSGIVGKLKIKTEASPLKVKVGDPITLKITLSGVEDLEKLILPEISAMKNFNKNFKIPDDRARGKVLNNTKTFVQSLRAKNSSVKKIPALSLSYFDVEKKSYQRVYSNEIPLLVEASKTISADDIVSNNSGSGIISKILHDGKGIFYNYSGKDLLINEEFFLDKLLRNLFIWIFILPPFVFLILFFINRYSGIFSRYLNIINTSVMLKRKLNSSSFEKAASALFIEEFYKYLLIKNKLTQSENFSVLKTALIKNGLNKNNLKELNRINQIYENINYSAGVFESDSETLKSEIIDLAVLIEKDLK